MSKINVLDSSVYNRISAGEVVERPASVVKELLENSIDAGAKNIVVEVLGGGIKEIKVTDDGCGIMFDDLKKVFLPHATSKIATAEDLENIATLGFRGEALASISAVAQVTVFSKSVEEEIGGKITCNGGLIQKPTEYGTIKGTKIVVQNLFFNTPARLKFLRSERQEESAITNVVSRLIFANPDLSIKYIANGKVVYNATLSGLKQKIYNIYGKDTIENIVEINANDGDYKLSGFISKPTFCKANRTYQTTVINGRYVNNAMVSTAVLNAYENFLMKGRFPLFVLNLTLPVEEVDVNVHPSKMEVKFRTSNKIFSFIYSSILQTLNESNFSIFYGSDIQNNVKNDNIFANNPQNSNENETESASLKEKDGENPSFYEHKNAILGEVKNGFSFGAMKDFSASLGKINIASPTFKNDDGMSKLATDDNFVGDTFKNKPVDFTQNFAKIDSVFASNAEQQNFNKTIAYKVVGTVFDTYLAVECCDSFYLFDQHAGHERILFDKFMSLFESKKLNSQPLLLPYVFDVNEEEKVLVADNISVFEELGFGIEEFGNNSFKITFVPAILSGINLGEFLQDALQNINKISKTNEVIKKHFATCACKAAVKGGQNLSDNEIVTLLDEILSSKHTLLCPHGRPICIELTKYQIEKMFKRIV
jgi:DNA mismatch repair protein MutL